MEDRYRVIQANDDDQYYAVRVSGELILDDQNTIYSVIDQQNKNVVVYEGFEQSARECAQERNGEEKA
jgi:hypothetical protein